MSADPDRSRSQALAMKDTTPLMIGAHKWVGQCYENRVVLPLGWPPLMKDGSAPHRKNMPNHRG